MASKRKNTKMAPAVSGKAMPKKRGKYYYVKWAVAIFFAVMFLLNIGMKNNKVSQREEILAGKMLGFRSGNSFDLDGDNLEELIVLEAVEDSYGTEAVLYVAGGDGSGLQELTLQGKGIGEKLFLVGEGGSVLIRIPKNAQDEAEGYHTVSFRDGKLRLEE